MKSRASAKKKLSVFDEVFLKDGTKGTVVEFDKSPIGYDICIRSSIGGSETVRRAGFAVTKSPMMNTRETPAISGQTPATLRNSLTHVSRRVTTS